MLNSRRKRTGIPAQATTGAGVWSLSDYQLMVDTSIIHTAIPVHPLSSTPAHAGQPNTPQDHEPAWPIHNLQDVIAIPQTAQPLSIPLPPPSSSPSRIISAATCPIEPGAFAPAAATFPPSLFAVGSLANDRPPIPWPAQIQDLKTPVNEEWPAIPATEEDLLLFQMDDWKL